MPQPIPPSGLETPLRRQITTYNFSVALDGSPEPVEWSPLTASVGFTDIWLNNEGNPVPYPVIGNVILTNDEILACNPHALEVIESLQQLAWQKAAEQGM